MAKKRKSTLYQTQSTSTARPGERKFPTWAWFAIGGVVAVLLILGLFYLDSQSIRSGGDQQAVRGIEGAIVVPDPGAGHLDGDIPYPTLIPPGGPHNPIWQNCGIYDEPVRTENVVHSMEHGAVWIAYQPDLPEDEVEGLRDLVRGERSRLNSFYVLAPHPDLEVPIVATAWRTQLEVESADDDRLLEFMQRFHVGPFTPERGATCSGGVGEPNLN